MFFEISLPTPQFWAKAKSIQEQFQGRYSNDPVAYDGRTGIRFSAQDKQCTIMDAFPDGVRFAVDGVGGRTFYETYDRLIEVGAVYA